MLLRISDLTVRTILPDALPVASGVERTRSASNAHLWADPCDSSWGTPTVERAIVLAKPTFETLCPTARGKRR